MMFWYDHNMGISETEYRERIAVLRDHARR